MVSVKRAILTEHNYLADKARAALIGFRSNMTKDLKLDFGGQG
jgi:hypothetical protein